MWRQINEGNDMTMIERVIHLAASLVILIVAAWLAGLIVLG